MHTHPAMRRQLQLGLLLLSAISAQVAWGREVIQNIESVHFPAGLSAFQIEKAIVLSGDARGWVITPLEAGHLLGVLNVRRHTAEVDIHFDAERYSITYRSSSNLDYKEGKIHPKYNAWIRNLNNDISSALLHEVYADEP